MWTLLYTIEDGSKPFAGMVARGTPSDACALRFSEGAWLCYPDPARRAGQPAGTPLPLWVAWESSRE